jgi:hypothetical protein
MLRTFTRQLLSTALSLLLVVTTVQTEALGQQAPPPGTNGYSGQGAPLSADELQQLVAPIALYPDALVAQILGAATFPDQVSAADIWLEQNKSLTGNALMQAANAQPWDPSVKALTQFPSVLDNMAKNLSWTSALGEAYHNQSADVMTSVQVLRGKAYAAGNLKSGSQITVVQQSPQTIVIQPTNPQVVYVPEYNPTVVYGYPVQTPGYSTATVVATGLLAFGAGIAVGAAMSGGCCGWGYSSWNCNWHGGAVVYGGGAYYGNNAWHGGYYGSSASAYGAYGSAHYSQGYNPSTGTYARGGTVSNGYGTASAGQAYNPSTGTYARGASESTPYGSNAAAQAYNPRTGAYAQTSQHSNAYGNYGSSEYSRNGETTNTQHQTTSQGSVATAENSSGGKAYAGTGANGNSAGVETANGNKYAAQNGNVYKNTGSGWQQTQGSSHYNSSSYSSASQSSHYNGSSYSGASHSSGSSYSGASASERGWGQQGGSSRSSAFGGGEGGWQSRADSARGSYSRGGGGGGWRR